MSRIGKQQLAIPAGTTVTLDNGVCTVTGPKGTLTRELLPNVIVTIENGVDSFAPNGDDKFSVSLWGTYASHIKNMIAGINTPFVKKLILEGVGIEPPFYEIILMPLS